MKASGSRYRLDLCYEGSGFEGWQSQPSGRAVQDHVESALKTILRTSVRVTGASRTDTGVHAMHQVATFSVLEELDVFRTLASLKGLLPPSIGIRGLQKVDSHFHPITSAVGKAYRYRFWLDSRRNPFEAPFAWSVNGVCDRAHMAEAASLLIGEHDFSSFCAADSSAKTRVRRIFDISWQHDGPLCDMWISGNGFLKQMVRSIAGTVLEAGLGKRSPRSVQETLEARNRQVAGITAPAHGLMLARIFYEKPADWSDAHHFLTW